MKKLLKENEMKFISNFMSKKLDGGPKSPVDAYFLIEIKSMFTICLLRFNKGGRESFHTHAFNALTWFMWGSITEEDVDGSARNYKRSILPKITPRAKYHRVIAAKDSWCLSLRGPWVNEWREFNKKRNETTILTKGRSIKEKYKGLV